MTDNSQGAQHGGGLRRWLAYAIHPDTPLWRAAESVSEFSDIVEQARQTEFAVREAEERVTEAPVDDGDLEHIEQVSRIGREWDRLKQAMGVEFDE